MYDNNNGFRQGGTEGKLLREHVWRPQEMWCVPDELPECEATAVHNRAGYDLDGAPALQAEPDAVHVL